MVKGGQCLLKKLTQADKLGFCFILECVENKIVGRVRR